jgi:hypothetical protein
LLSKLPANSEQKLKEKGTTEQSVVSFFVDRSLMQNVHNFALKESA